MLNEKVYNWLKSKGFENPMKRFAYVHPAGGNGYTSVKLTPEELEKASDAAGWCDVCRGWEEDGTV